MHIATRSARPSRPVAEIVTFRLQPGIGVRAFLAAAEASRAILAEQPGFLRRRLSRDDAGLWTDHVEWADAASARAAADALMKAPDFAPFMAAIAPEGLVMRHAGVLLAMGD